MKKRSLALIIFQLPIQRHIWQIFEQTCYFFTLWWKISICHYLMVWGCLSERRLLFFDLCLFVFASLFWLPLHFSLSPLKPLEQDSPTSLLWVSTQHPPPPLLPSLRRGVDGHRDSCQLDSCCGKRRSEREKSEQVLWFQVRTRLINCVCVWACNNVTC